jgi:cold-inducible RNA-binding protein
MKNLFIGNMNFQTTEGDLRALFEPFGQITRVHVAMDRETGRPRGFAFVEVADDNGASKAITALNGKDVGGRALRVNEAVPKSERRGPSVGFGPRGNSDCGRFSNEDYRESARQPREPRW